MIYTHNLINCTREQLLHDVQQQMSDKRFQHILRVEAEALRIADHYQFNSQEREAISIASLLHDYAKEYPLPQLVQLATTFWQYPYLECEGNNVLHGIAAAQIAKDKYACRSQEILFAIAGHTIGWQEMSRIAQVVYLADYIEPQRNFPGVDEARILTYHNLQEATWYKMTQTLTHLIKKRTPLFAGLLEIYNTWIQQEEL